VIKATRFHDLFSTARRGTSNGCDAGRRAVVCAPIKIPQREARTE
jgi:hypothetical protein